ncbi:cobalamin biosynthesis protein [Krasilnikovia sp. MM14-A1004]|uniref:cobalamin biosynthesis protein n=1 Tax=Krasilnikovia sp. MM14-A1004 TaxID=3373541 RepID=UPI00399CACC5
MVVGVGARGGVPEEELDRAIDAALAAAAVPGRDVGMLATLDRRADPALRAVAARRGWTLRAFRPEQLAAVPVPHPSPRVAVAAGTPSVAEAAALLAAGRGARLILPKSVRSGVTVAAATGAGDGWAAAAAGPGNAQPARPEVGSPLGPR